MIALLGVLVGGVCGWLCIDGGWRATLAAVVMFLWGIALGAQIPS